MLVLKKHLESFDFRDQTQRSDIVTWSEFGYIVDIYMSHSSQTWCVGPRLCPSMYVQKNTNIKSCVGVYIQTRQPEPTQPEL